MKAILTRELAQDKQTLGRLELLNDAGQKVFECKTLELPNLDNRVRVSCIPKGKYKVTPRTSPKYGSHFLVNNVPGRTAILIHQGNYHTDILGCILVGTAHIDINGDGYKDVTSSKSTLHLLTNLAPKGFELNIV